MLYLILIIEWLREFFDWDWIFQWKNDSNEFNTRFNGFIDKDGNIIPTECIKLLDKREESFNKLNDCLNENVKVLNFQTILINDYLSIYDKYLGDSDNILDRMQDSLDLIYSILHPDEKIVSESIQEPVIDSKSIVYLEPVVDSKSNILTQEVVNEEYEEFMANLTENVKLATDDIFYLLNQQGINVNSDSNINNANIDFEKEKKKEFEFEFEQKYKNNDYIFLDKDSYIFITDMLEACVHIDKDRMTYNDFLLFIDNPNHFQLIKDWINNYMILHPGGDDYFIVNLRSFIMSLGYSEQYAMTTLLKILNS